MKTKKILYLFLLPLIFTACETKDIPVYTSDDAALYFQRTASYIWGSTTVTYSNSTEFTFAGAAAEAGAGGGDSDAGGLHAHALGPVGHQRR